MAANPSFGGVEPKLETLVFPHQRRSEVHAEWSGVMSDDYGKVSGTRRLHKEPASASWSQICTR